MQSVNIISLGGGKQSTYMLIQALRGEYGVKPDYAIFSDTGCEPRYVYDAMKWLSGYCKRHFDFDITVVGKGNLMQHTIDYVDGKSIRVATLPYFLQGGGIMRRQCTLEYKIAPIRKWIKENIKKLVRLWIGISLDEMERMKASDVGYITNYYPLVESMTRLSSIVKWYKDNNMREPGKSACVICPFHSHTYWKALKDKHPEEFAKAVEFDERIRNYPKLRKQAFIYRYSMPLKEVDFDSQQEFQFAELIEECEGICGL
jgi:hypothetical protein